jgi:hypothetical protein
MVNDVEVVIVAVIIGCLDGHASYYQREMARYIREVQSVA